MEKPLSSSKSRHSRAMEKAPSQRNSFASSDKRSSFASNHSGTTSQRQSVVAEQRGSLALPSGFNPGRRRSSSTLPTVREPTAMDLAQDGSYLQQIQVEPRLNKRAIMIKNGVQVKEADDDDQTEEALQTNLSAEIEKRASRSREKDEPKVLIISDSIEEEKPVDMIVNPEFEDTIQESLRLYRLKNQAEAAGRKKRNPFEVVLIKRERKNNPDPWARSNSIRFPLV